MLFDELESDDDLYDTDDNNNLIVSNELSSPSTLLKDARTSSTLFAHHDLEKKLYHLLSSDRPPQGLVFTGPMGVGKATMAFRVARFLLQQREETLGLFGEPEPRAKNLHVPEADPVFHLIASGGHPDLLTIERAIDEKTDLRKGSLSVEELRKITPFLRKTASVDNGWRVVIVDDADTMTRSSQNALLKILEEPPPKALLILITHRLSSLLPTILSRVSVVHFSTFQNDELKRILLESHPHLSDDQIQNILHMAEGSLGRALDYAKEDQIELISTMKLILGAVPHVNWSQAQLLAQSLGAKESEPLLRTFQDIIINFLNDRIKHDVLTGQDATAYFDCLDKVKSEFFRAQAGNLDKRLLVLSAFDALADLPPQS